MFVVLIRTVLLYLFIIVGIRLLGKHQIGQLEPSELVLTLIIADLASVPMQDNGIPLLAGLIPIVVLLALSSIISVLCTKSIRFRALLCGRPSVVVENGQVVEAELRKNRLTLDELMEELRIQGYADFKAIKFALLETNGQLSVLPYAADKPVTAAQMGVARSTVQQVYDTARRRLAQALVEGRRLHISGGDYVLCPRGEECPGRDCARRDCGMGRCGCGACLRSKEN